VIPRPPVSAAVGPRRHALFAVYPAQASATRCSQPSCRADNDRIAAGHRWSPRCVICPAHRAYSGPPQAARISDTGYARRRLGHENGGRPRTGLTPHEPWHRRAETRNLGSRWAAIGRIHADNRGHERTAHLQVVSDIPCWPPWYVRSRRLALEELLYARERPSATRARTDRYGVLQAGTQH
jgi:hypothetical protein